MITGKYKTKTGKTNGMKMFTPYESANRLSKMSQINQND
jgi:hypothetical protein